MITFSFVSNFGRKKQRLNKAITAIEECYDIFLIELSKKPLFPRSNITGKGLKNIFEEQIWTFKIKKYWNPFSSALAYTKPSRPNTIHINSAKLRRSTASIAGTLIHEAVHLLDFHKDSYEFGHSYKWNKNRKYTAPYWCGSIMSRIIESEFEK